MIGGRFRLSDSNIDQRQSLIGKLADPIPLVSLALALLICLPNQPVFQTILQGQADLLVFLPLALVPGLERRGHPRWTGAMVAVAAMLKFTPAILLLYFVARRRWQVVIAALAVLGGLAVLCAVVMSPSVVLASVTQAFHVGAADASSKHNEALLAPLVWVLNSALPGTSGLLRGLEYVVLAGIALGCGFVLFRWWRPTNSAIVDREKDAAGYGIALCLMLLLWPTAWIHHYVWVLPAAATALGLIVARLLIARTLEAVWRTLRLLLLTGIFCHMVVATIPNAWDSIENPVVTTYWGLPLRPLFLSFRALGTLGLLGILSY